MQALARYGHVLLSTWIAEQERTVLAAAEVPPPLGDEAGGAPGHGGTSSTFNQVTSWQVRMYSNTGPRGLLHRLLTMASTYGLRAQHLRGGQQARHSPACLQSRFCVVVHCSVLGVICKGTCNARYKPLQAL